MDRRTLTFIAISVLIIVGYQEFVLKRLAPPAETPTPVETMEARQAPVEGPSSATSAAAWP